MENKIFAQVTIKAKASNKKALKVENNGLIEQFPSAAQIRKVKNRLIEAGCEITSIGPTIGIALEVDKFNELFNTYLNDKGQLFKENAPLTIPKSLEDIITEVAIATPPDFY